MRRGTKRVNHDLKDGLLSEKGKKLFFSSFAILEDNFLYNLTTLDEVS
jgi:hypothetical protein